MKVTILDATQHPLQLISYAAGICYGKQDKYSETRIESCIKNGHTSVIEHAHVSYLIEGISRSCLAQLSRHRHTSLSVQSQRYVKFDQEMLNRGNWFVTPPEIQASSHRNAEYANEMHNRLVEYINLLNGGIKPEDARFLLPESTKTTLMLSTNARELQSILKLRLDSHAQWEIRELANKFVLETKAVNKEWSTLIDWLLKY